MVVKSKEKIKISLVISVYKNRDFLDLVLASVGLQTFKDFEVIIAEDADSEEMKKFVEDKSKVCDFKIKHVFHEDRGFRKTKSLNEALRVAKGEFVVFIDGDCVLHKKFLEEYAKRANKTTCLFGRRVNLDRETTDKLLKTKDLKLLLVFRLLFTKARRIGDGIYLPFPTTRRKTGVKGSNFCVSREKMYEINGFDEDFEMPTCGEDDDIERRLKLIGVKMKCTRNKTIQYHLYHERKGREEDSEHNIRLYQKKVETGKGYCENGINK